MRVLCTLVLMMSAVQVYASQPARFNYQAKLNDSGGIPLAGAHTMFFSLFQGGTAGGGGTEIFRESAVIDVSSGVANHTVGTGANLLGGSLSADMLRFSGDIYLQSAVDVDTNVILPRTRLESVPFAITSADGDPRIPLSQPGSFPIVLSQPGAYYLTSNITGVSGQHGISVTTDSVSIDLNGFALIGVPGSLTGINTGITLKTLAVRNGTVRNWGVHGIDASGDSQCSFYQLNLTSNGSWGLRGGNSCIIENCTATANNSAGAAGGFHTNLNSLVRRCVSVGNIPSVPGSATGIQAGNSCMLEANVCIDNDGNGPGSGAGISSGASCTIVNNTCQSNGSGNSGSASGVGIKTDSGSLITGNICNSNFAISGSNGNGNGIDAGNRSHILDNVCALNSASGTGIASGILAETRCHVERNHCSESAGGSASYGIRVNSGTGGGTVVVNNSTSGNTTAGIRFDNTTGPNYHGGNIIDEVTPVSQAAAVNVAGTGDRTNISY